jgi:PleD family two-component response regulator
MNTPTITPPPTLDSQGLAPGTIHIAGQGISNIRVLVVDDQNSVRQLIAYELKRSGATEVYQANDADSALEMFKNTVLIWCCWIYACQVKMATG